MKLRSILAAADARPIGMRWVSSMCVEHVHRFLFSEAVVFVKQVQAASPGWRLPTRDEMKTLAAADGQHPVDNELFSDLTDSECFYWTSTPFKALNGSNAALYYMGDFAFDGSTKNNEYIGDDDDRFYGCVILVRSKLCDYLAPAAMRGARCIKDDSPARPLSAGPTRKGRRHS